LGRIANYLNLPDVQYFRWTTDIVMGFFGIMMTKLTLFFNPKNNPFLKPTYEYATIEDHEVDYES